MTKHRVLSLLVASAFDPTASHGVNAAPVVLYQLLSALAAQPDITVKFLRVGQLTTDTQESRDTRQNLEEQGVAFLEPLCLSNAKPSKRAIVSRLLSPLATDYYPIIEQSAAANQRVADIAPDALLIPWSETLTALFSEAPTVRVAYYGNPDPKNLMAQGVVARKSGRWAYWALWSLLRRQLTHFHLSTMTRYHAIGDVAANDAEYYRRQGHPNAFYVPNIWLDRFGSTWPEMRDKLEATASFRIVGNIGRQSATANTLGMDLLGARILPRLAEIMRDKIESYEVDILGAGKSISWVQHTLMRPEVRLLGFVDDIDHHLLSSHVVLCANNGSVYNVGHTRYLHAWSLGCCLVLHQNARLAMPEISHGVNALLGESPEHMAELTKEALYDKALRRRLGEGGYETFLSRFTARPVGTILADLIRSTVTQTTELTSRS